jgi:hypothetical protein
MIFKLFGRTIQIRSPIKVYEKDEPIYIETMDEFVKIFGDPSFKPGVTVTEHDHSTREVMEKISPFVTRAKKENIS